MKEIAAVRVLNFLGFFNSLRFFYYRHHRQFRRQRVFYAHFINKGDLCFDIGANIGLKTDLFLSLGAKVVALEPQVDCVRFMSKVFKNSPRLTLLQQAVGDHVGTQELYVCEANALSSTSTEWIGAVKKSGRYAAYQWDNKGSVAVITLDQLIAEFGIPKFCKIDVEGSELHVLKGLNQPIPLLSIEISPETVGKIKEGVAHLMSLGSLKFNFCWEAQQMIFDEWVDYTQVEDYIQGCNKNIYGDLYIRIT